MRSYLGLLLVLSVVSWAGDVATALAALTGARTRVAWVEDRDGGGDQYAQGDRLRLMGLDTGDAAGARAILPDAGSYHRPIITPDGGHIVFSRFRARTCCVVNWDGTGLRDLGAGVAVAVWRDPETGADWVYAQAGPRGDLFRNPLVRFRLDDPAHREVVWDKTPITVAPNNNAMLSADGTRLAADFPWPHAGVANLVRGDWQQLGTGCWVGLAPDNSYRMWVFEGPHKGVVLFDPSTAIRRRVDLTGAPGMLGRAVYHPRWSNHVRVMCMTGPEGGRNQLYVGRFDAAYAHIESWAQITTNSPAALYPDVWVSGPDPDANARPALLPLPDPWREAAIGDGMGGSAANAAGDLILQGNGRDIYGTADACRFIYQRMRGDCAITAHVAAAGDAGPNARVGVMLRGGDGPERPDAVQAHMVLRPKEGGRMSFCVRTARGRGSSENERPAQPTGWVRLVRQGDAVTAFNSADGKAWTALGTTTLPLGEEALVGLCLSSDGEFVATATFDHVVVVGTPAVTPDAPRWPVTIEGLVFGWQQAGTRLSVPAADAWRVEPRGRAIWAADRAMSTAGGWFDAEGAGEAWATAVRTSRAAGMQALITADRVPQAGARILTAGNFRLAQEGDRLLVSLRTTAAPDGSPWFEVGRLAAGVPCHVVINYTPGHLNAYLNGKPALHTDRAVGDVTNWAPQPLRVGREADGAAAWDGRVACLALYGTVLDATAVIHAYAAVQTLLAQRSAVPRLVVEASLVAVAEAIRPQHMAPYRRALRVHIYAIERVDAGAEPAPRIAVAHWQVLDNAPLPERAIGQRVTLTLERFTDHPELEGELRADAVDFGDLPLYYCDVR